MPKKYGKMRTQPSSRASLATHPQPCFHLINTYINGAVNTTLTREIGPNETLHIYYALSGTLALGSMVRLPNFEGTVGGYDYHLSDLYRGIYKCYA